MQSILTDIADRFHLTRKSGKWVGACPQCGGSKTSDKFNIRDDGGFKCYSCEFRGDIITWLRTMDGLSCPEAHERAGRPCRVDSCQVRDKCRLGSGTSTGVSHRPASVRPSAQRHQSPLPVCTVTAPNRLWSTWAAGLLQKAQENILHQPDVLAWLAGRGLDQSAVVRFGLGWLEHQYQVPRESIGLTKVKNDKTTLWVPEGLLIPIHDRRGNLHRLRVRRSEEARNRFLPNLKYVWLDGSGNGPLVIRPVGQCRGVAIIESELDAFAVASSHDAVMVIGIGSVSGPLPEKILYELKDVPVVLVALDADPGKDGKLGAGPKAFQAWRAAYRQAKFWTVPEGKDAGDYFGRGGDLRLWIEAGLPPAAENIQDPAFSPGSFPRGGRGGEINSDEKPAAATDIYATAIKALPQPERDAAMSFYQIMQGNPITCWLSPDGLDCGIIDTTGDWRQRYPELSAKFSGLFYGPAHGALCEIFRDKFIRNMRMVRRREYVAARNEQE